MLHLQLSLARTEQRTGFLRVLAPRNRWITGLDALDHIIFTIHGTRLGLRRAYRVAVLVLADVL